MESKADLVNCLVYRLADKVEMPISELKAAIEISMYEYNIEKIVSTELTVGGAGNITEQLWMYFEIGKLSQNIARGTLEQYKLVVYQLCATTGKELNLITSDDVKVFLLKMKMVNGCSDVTVNNKRLNLSSVFSYLYAHERMHKGGIEYILRQRGKLSGVYRLHPHLVRATFATNLLRKGVPIEVIAKLLGHANLNTIHRYVLVTDEFAKIKYTP